MRCTRCRQRPSPSSTRICCRPRCPSCSTGSFATSICSIGASSAVTRPRSSSTPVRSWSTPCSGSSPSPSSSTGRGCGRRTGARGPPAPIRMTTMTGAVAILRTRPETVVEDYGRLMRLVKYDQILTRERDLILKLNLSWTKYFPACSSQPWQGDGVLTTLLADGFDRGRLFPVENKTVVTDPVAGCRNNKWTAVLERHGLPFIPLPNVEWTVHRFTSPLLKLNEIFPEGIEIPK